MARSLQDLLVVEGTARRSAPPDKATFRFTVSTKAATASEAERATATAATALDSVLDAHSDTLGTRVTTSVSIQPEQYWHQETGRQVPDGYRASRTVRVDLGEPGQAGELLRAVYGVADVQTFGPFWQLHDDHPIYDEVRAAAAVDARRRALAYAGGADVSVGVVAFVAEPGFWSSTPAAGAVGLTVAAARAAPESDGSGPVMDISADEIVVTAAVDVGFRIER